MSGVGACEGKRLEGLRGTVDVAPQDSQGLLSPRPPVALLSCTCPPTPSPTSWSQPLFSLQLVGKGYIWCLSAFCKLGDEEAKRGVRGRGVRETAGIWCRSLF